MNNLLLHVEDKIALLTINRPKVLNALNTETLCELNATLYDLDQRPDVHAVILTGSGSKSFVSGIDINELVTGSPQGNFALSSLAYEAFNLLENIHQVTIAGVNGYALGAGCDLATACDIRIASRNARFGYPECTLGIMPGCGGTQRLPRLIGKGFAKELIFTGDTIPADKACSLGLVNHVVAPQELITSCQVLAKRIMQNDAGALSLAKQSINAGLCSDLSSGLKLESSLFGLAFAANEQHQGLQAFLKRNKTKKHIEP